MDFSSLIEMESVIFIEMIIGAFLKKIGIVNDASKVSLVDIVIYVALPASIIKAFQIEMNTEIIKTCFLMFLVTLAFQFICMGIGMLLFRKKQGSHKAILKYGTVCSNSGILGNTVAESLFSDTGILYASIALVPVRAFMWSYGLALFTEAPSKGKLIKKVISHPCIIAVIIGLFLMITQIELPVIVNKVIYSIANMSSPLATISVGTILADVKLKELLTKDTLEMAFSRLILVPLIALLGCKILGLSQIITGITVIFASMPVANTTAILASKYHYDEQFASACVVFTTIISVITTPLWCAFII